MSCPEGYHQHQTSRGVMSRCHRISEKHENEVTQRYHEMALAGKSSEQELTQTPQSNKKPKFQIPPEQKEKIKQNNAKIKQYIRRMQSGSKTWKNLLAPIVCGLWAYEGLVKRGSQLKAKAKTKSQAKMVDAYNKAVSDIIEATDSIDVSKFPRPDRTKKYTPEEIHQLKAEQRQFAKKCISEIQNQQKSVSKKYLELKKSAQEKGKGSIEYAQYMAYRDYMNMCNMKTMTLSTMVGMDPPMQPIFSEVESRTTTSKN